MDLRVSYMPGKHSNSHIPGSTTNTAFSRKKNGKGECFPMDTQQTSRDQNKLGYPGTGQCSDEKAELLSRRWPLTLYEPVSRKAQPGLGLVLGVRHKQRERDFGLTCHLSLAEKDSH